MWQPQSPEEELQWLDMTKRPTATANVEGAAGGGGYVALQGAKEKKNGNMLEQTRGGPRPCETNQLRVGWQARTAGDLGAPRVDDESGRSTLLKVQRCDGSLEAETDPGANPEQSRSACSQCVVC